MNGADASQDLGGVEGTDAAELGQGAPRCVDGGLDVGGGFGDTAVQPADLGDEVDRLVTVDIDVPTDRLHPPRWISPVVHVDGSARATEREVGRR